MSQQIQTQVSGSTLIITIARPEAKNALSLAMYQSLTQALRQFDQDDKLTSAIVYGSEQCFTAGNDLKDFLAGGELNHQHPTVQFLHQLVRTEKPLIAAVAGPAIGIGTTMLLHCDLVVASENSVFQLPFSKLGLCPEAASSALLPKQIGRQLAFELLVLGNRFDAVTGKELGLINSKVEEGEALTKAMEYAEQLSKLPLDAVKTSKRLINEDKDRIANIIDIELTQFQRLMDSSETKSIIANFFKR